MTAFLLPNKVGKSTQLYSLHPAWPQNKVLQAVHERLVSDVATAARRIKFAFSLVRSRFYLATYLQEPSESKLVKAAELGVVLA